MAFADEHIERVVISGEIESAFRVDGDVVGVAEKVVRFAGCRDSKKFKQGLAALLFLDRFAPPDT